MEKRAAFKPYQQHQLSFLPIDLESLIPENHMVRVVDRAIEAMNTEPLFERYPGGGTSAYNPVMMLKVIVYAYADKIYSSRKIAKATRENINFMWLTGNVQLDFMTINRFRGERLNGIIDDIFTEVVDLLLREEYIKFENYFLDGTKIEANASKYSWVWGKSTARYKENLRKKVIEHLTAINIIEQEESEEYGEMDLPEMGNGKPIDSESIREAAAKIDEKLTVNPKDKALKKAKKTIEKDFLPRMEKYEHQEEILKERKSYSKTDIDATFMRMKEDHMKNGQLKPGYNIQMGTENQFVIGFSMHQRPGDTSCMKQHLEHLKELHGKLPKNIVADAGYGSEENYEFLESEKVEHFVKYNTFHKEKSSKWRKDMTRVQNWYYVEERDEYICGYGRYLSFLYEKKQKSENGYESLIRVYESEDCSDCPLRDQCVKGEKPDADRRIYINRRLNELKEIAKANLDSEKGLEMRSKRPIEVESAFGDIKGNFGVRRFLLRGLEKVKIEWGLYSIGHNMRKIAAARG
ncbi:MAG: IS1182 family transposase [Oscillospiraceae bacterium]|nr:IS1182 family transposase [Oscillospiraceae bacterium]